MLSWGLRSRETGRPSTRGIFILVRTNLTTAQQKTASRCLHNDWIIQNDFTLEKLSFRELYDFTTRVISKQKDFCAIKQHRIIINDYNAYFDTYMSTSTGNS
jgi:hypothetical protein